MLALEVAPTMEMVREFNERGYVIVRDLFGRDEIGLLIDTFMRMHTGGPIPGCFAPVPPERANGDMLKLYPRMMHPHRVNDIALRYLLDPRLATILAGLFGEEPLTAQSMLYFKPAGARGQALHQDNFYLKVEPGTCIAAWMALDDCDEANGCMQIVPGSPSCPLLCTTKADTSVSFTDVTVPLPPGVESEPVVMVAGD